MFEAAELGRKLTKEEYKAQEPALRVGLLTVQYELRDADFPVVVVVTGDDRPGCSEVANLLHEWMDARLLEANAFERPSAEERDHPRFWRYWTRLPAAGRIGLFLGEWSTRAIVDRATGHIEEVELDRRIRHIQAFERALTDDGAVVLKLWLHVPRKQLKKRIRAADKDASLAWTLRKEDRAILEHYELVRRVAEEVVRRTSRGAALWHVIETTDRRYRDATVAQLLIQTLMRRLAEPLKKRAPARPPSGGANPITVLDRVDLTKRLGKATYERKLHRYWPRLARLSRQAHDEGLSVVMAFEGWDASGKGGVIRRLTKAIDATSYRVIPIAAPTEEERAHHYLWRFWRRLPRAGHFAIFDRSWYGRVLVERLEGFAEEREWRRAFAEINDFEEQIVQNGTLLLKFWMHISPEEQLRRFELREKVPFKKYKITKEDYRNRERWNDYEAAADEMIQRTSTDYARWNLIAGDDKRWARIQVLRTTWRALERALQS